MAHRGARTAAPLKAGQAPLPYSPLPILQSTLQYPASPHIAALPHSPSVATSPCLLGIQVTCTFLPYLSSLLFPLTTPISSFYAQ